MEMTKEEETMVLELLDKDEDIDLAIKLNKGQIKLQLYEKLVDKIQKENKVLKRG